MQLAPLLISFIFAIVLTPIVKKLAFKFNLLDYPTEKRKIHKKPIPLAGGIVIFIVIVISFKLILPEVKILLEPLFWGMLGMLLIGVFDDKVNMRATHKLFAQLLVVSLFVWASDLAISYVGISFIHFDIPVFIGFILAVGWIVAMVNAVNLIDGVDGLASGIVLIVISTLFFSSMGSSYSMEILMLICMGTIFGFLFYNFNPATIFLGDGGSMMLGFLVGAIGLSEMKTITFVTTLPILLMMFLPIIDVVMAIIRRAYLGKHIFQPDGRHLHHRLLARGLKQRQVVITMYVITLIYALCAYFLTLFDEWYFDTLLYLIIIIVTVLLIEQVYITNKKFRFITNFLKILRKV